MEPWGRGTVLYCLTYSTLATLQKNFNWLTAIFCVTIFSFVLNLQGIKYDLTATFYSPQTRFWELLIGAIAAYLLLYIDGHNTFLDKSRVLLNRIVYSKGHNFDRNILPNTLSILGVIFIGFTLTKISKQIPYPGYWGLLPTVGTACLILSGSHTWINRVILGNRFLVAIGLISYPLYL